MVPEQNTDFPPEDEKRLPPFAAEHLPVSASIEQLIAVQRHQAEITNAVCKQIVIKIIAVRVQRFGISGSEMAKDPRIFFQIP